MATEDYRRDIAGFEETEKEIEVLKKYGMDYSTQRGRVRQIIDMLHPERIHLVVSRIRRETESTKTLRFIPREGWLPPFQAGQYINLFLEIDGVRTSRPYSISSPPNQTGYYEITVRKGPGGFVSAHLCDAVKKGDEFVSGSPTGNFYYNPLYHGDDLVFLAGGSGITPFMSMIREVTDRGLGRNIHLVYGSRSEDEIIFGDELTSLAGQYGNFTLTRVISEPTPGYEGRTGFISAELLKSVLGALSSKTFYICGPEAMYSFCLPELRKLDVPRRRIRREVFGLPSDITAQPGWPSDVSGREFFEVEIKGRETIEAKAAEPLMASLERAGLVIPASCRSGECSLCRTKLLSGKVFQPAEVKMRSSDGRFGWIHPCAAYPLENLEILI